MCLKNHTNRNNEKKKKCQQLEQNVFIKNQEETYKNVYDIKTHGLHQKHTTYTKVGHVMLLGNLIVEGGIFFISQ